MTGDPRLPGYKPEKIGDPREPDYVLHLVKPYLGWCSPSIPRTTLNIPPPAPPEPVAPPIELSDQMLDAMADAMVDPEIVVTSLGEAIFARAGTKVRRQVLQRALDCAACNGWSLQHK